MLECQRRERSYEGGKYLFRQGSRWWFSCLLRSDFLTYALAPPAPQAMPLPEQQPDLSSPLLQGFFLLFFSVPFIKSRSQVPNEFPAVSWSSPTESSPAQDQRCSACLRKRDQESWEWAVGLRGHFWYGAFLQGTALHPPLTHGTIRSHLNKFAFSLLSYIAYVLSADTHNWEQAHLTRPS